MNNQYDYLIIGAGIFGAVSAYELTKKGYKCLVIEKRNHIAGNCFTESIEGINVHKYGAHIFHTNDKNIWDYVNQFAEFNRYTNSPIANYKGEIYNLPFNMNTFHQLWNVKTPDEARAIIAQQANEFGVENPSNFTYDNNYFNDKYQGIPIGGYTQIFEKLLEGIEVRLDTDYFENKEYWNNLAENIIYTGPIDAFFDYKFGQLNYRSLRFENELHDQENYQGVAVVNYTSHNEKYTRIIEHKHFEYGTQSKTYITKEYSDDWNLDKEPYYPINNQENDEIFSKYKSLSKEVSNVIFGGRLAEYKYYDMHQVFGSALVKMKNIPNKY